MSTHGGPAIVSSTPIHNACAYSKYLECVTVTKATPFTQEWCISTNGSRTTVYPGVWTWALPITTTKGKKYKKLASSWSPNPGNPSTLTISEKKKVKSSKGKVKYEGALSACSPTYGCVYGTLPIGIMTN